MLLAVGLPEIHHRAAGWSLATVLVVDDEPAVREVVASLLEEEGYAVRRARDGLQALEAMNESTIDLVVSDVSMPVLDGPTLVREMRCRGYVGPVVLMSAVYADVDLPGVRFVPKPFDLDHLLAAVERALATSC
ncbi:MAG: response regulator [Thermomicrobiales bacterium]